MSMTTPVVRRLLASRTRQASHMATTIVSADISKQLSSSPRQYIPSPSRSKTALVFPGQGVQRVGMLTPWLEAFPSTTREFIDELDSRIASHDPRMPSSSSSSSSSSSFSSLIQRGSKLELNATENAQPAIMATSLLILRVLERHFGFRTADTVDYTLGHSLGEFAALVAAGHLCFADSLHMVRRRACVMAKATARAQDAHLGAEYGMVAVITEPEYLQSLIDTVHRIVGEHVHDWSHTPVDGQVCIANVNSRNQIVLSGNILSISRVLDRVRHFSGHDPRAVRLSSESPFHSPLMKPAGRVMRTMLETPGVVKFPGHIQCVSNISARPFANADELKDLVSRSGVEPVRWADSIRFLNEQAQVRRWIGIGPGKVGRNLVGKEVGIRGTDKARNAGVWALAEPGDIEELLRGLEETDGVRQMPDYAVHESMYGVRQHSMR